MGLDRDTGTVVPYIAILCRMNVPSLFLMMMMKVHKGGLIGVKGMNEYVNGCGRRGKGMKGGERGVD